MISLDHLRRFAVARTLFPPTTLKRAVQKLGFVQADPIRAPARAQDLILRHRVADYRADDLERRYAQLGIEEDVFINYGFMPKALNALMHPRAGSSLRSPWARSPVWRQRATALLEFVQSRNEAHPRDVDAHFAHGRVTNYWGGSSNATTHLLQHMHYSSMLRVVRRERGIRVYAAHEHPPPPSTTADRDVRLDALADVVVNLYAPLTAAGLSFALRRLRYATPQWTRAIPSVIKRAKARLAHARVDGSDWYWPAGDDPAKAETDDQVRLLAPFDPVVWDRRRFEQLWDWEYRFEAYTPAPKRIRGYYALPMLFRERVIGWANLSLVNGRLDANLGYAGGRPPRDRAFKGVLDLELDRVVTFLKTQV
jgi:uncharacterized protein YcaQ